MVCATATANGSRDWKSGMAERSTVVRRNSARSPGRVSNPSGNPSPSVSRVASAAR